MNLEQAIKDAEFESKIFGVCFVFLFSEGNYVTSRFMLNKDILIAAYSLGEKTNIY